MPPGLSGVLGIGCLVLGTQMALGRRYPWLPKQVAKLEFFRSLSQKLLKHIRRFTVWLEKIVRSRWQQGNFPKDAIAIFSIVILNGILGYFQEPRHLIISLFSRNGIILGFDLCV